MPDLQALIERYMLAKDVPNRAYEFIVQSGLGYRDCRRGIIKRVKAVLGNSRHQWLWDYESVVSALSEVGFKNIRRCKFHDSAYKEFESVEREDRFVNAISIECIR